MSTAKKGNHGSMLAYSKEDLATKDLSDVDLSTLDMAQFYYLPCGRLLHYTHPEIQTLSSHPDFKHQRMGTCVWEVNLKTGKVVVGKRLGSHGAGQWATPGGHIDLHEDIFDCAAREVLEETGLEVKNVRYIHGYHDNFVVSMKKEDKDKDNDDFADVDFNQAEKAKKMDAAQVHKIPRRYKSEWLVAEVADVDAEPKLMEPEKCAGWKWMTIEELRTVANERPEEMFLPMRNFFANNPNFCTSDLFKAGIPKDHRDRFALRSA